MLMRPYYVEDVGSGQGGVAGLTLPLRFEGHFCPSNRRGRFGVFSRQCDTNRLCLSFPVARLRARRYSPYQIQNSRGTSNVAIGGQVPRLRG